MKLPTLSANIAQHWETKPRSPRCLSPKPSIRKDKKFRKEKIKWRTVQNTKDREIIMSRLIDAPRDLVWEAMTKPEHVVHWWGPNGFTNTLEKLGFFAWEVSGTMSCTGRMEGTIRAAASIPRSRNLTVSSFCTGGTYKGDPKAMCLSLSGRSRAVAAQTKVTIHLLFPNAQARNMAVEKIGAIEGGQPNPLRALPTT